MNNELLKQLSRPFHPSQVKWKPGAVKGNRALALAYADLRAYMDRLDEVCAMNWSVTYTPWGNDKIICHLTIDGVTRSSTGESTGESERNDIGGTVSEAQSFKRAAVMFGLSRYLYLFPSTWADYDPSTKQFTDKAKAKLNGIVVTHFRRSGSSSPQTPQDARSGDSQANGTTDTTKTAQATVEAPDNPFDDKAESEDYVEIAPGEWANRLSEKQKNTLHALGSELYSDKWDSVRHRNVKKVTNGRTESSNELSSGEADKLIAGMLKLKSKRAEKVAA